MSAGETNGAAREAAGPGAPSPGDFPTFYARAYSRFPQERRAAGSLGLTLVGARQNSHETLDRGAEEVVLQVLRRAEVRDARADFGDGWRRLDRRSGTVVVTPARTDSLWRVDGPHELLLLCMPERHLRPLVAGEGWKDDPLRALHGRDRHAPELARLAEAIWAEAARPDPAAAMAADGLALQLLAGLARLAGELPPEPRGAAAPLDARRLARVEALVEARLADPITVEAMAAVACLSVFHFSRAFRAATGLTPARHVAARRVERARRLLAETDLPLAQVAFATGFASQSHFGQVFRDATGATPGAYRAEVRA